RGSERNGAKTCHFADYLAHLFESVQSMWAGRSGLSPCAACGSLDRQNRTDYCVYTRQPPKRCVEELANRKAGLATKCESLSAKRHSAALAILPCPDGAGV